MTISRTRTYQLTNPHNFVTITANNTAEMIGLESKYDRLECDEFRFLKEISGIDIDIAFKISFIPEFVESLKDFDGELNSETVYEVLKTVSNQMIKDGKMYKNARQTMNHVSKFIIGDNVSWNNTHLPNNNELSFLYKKSKINPSTISRIALVPEFMDALKKYKGDLTDDSIYEILKSESNRMLAKDKKISRAARQIMYRVSETVTGDKNGWKDENTIV